MKIKKILIISLIIFILVNILSLLNIKVYASENPLEKIIKEGRGFTEQEEASTTIPIQITVDKLQSTSKIISSVLFVVAVGVAVITTATLGINLMVQSAEEKAKTKEALVPLVIGMFVSFGAYGLWKVMVLIFAKI